MGERSARAPPSNAGRIRIEKYGSPTRPRSRLLVVP
jgi:hypothetical protein